MKRKVEFKSFRGTLTTWKTLFQEAADFATEVGAHDLICISHSTEGLVTVWFWTE